MAAPESASSSETMLVRTEHLDELLLLAGEVIIASSNQGISYRTLQALYDKSEPVSAEVLETAKDLSSTTSTLSSDLHHLVQSIRTVSLRDFGFRARRLVRDVARKTGKRVEFVFEGEETTIDKSIIDKLFDPVAHQLRNAIDHGIEDSLTRSRQGKPEEGHVTMRAYNTEQETLIEIEDDGQGIELEAIRARGIDEGLVDAGQPFDEDDALRLMCRPGFTMTTSVSEVSGRGVGMDVVYTTLSDLGGSASFTTTPGQGTKFVFRVPLISAVNIVDALVIRAGKCQLAFPIMNVVSTMAVAPETVSSTFGKGRSVKHLGHLLPLHDLSYLLDGTPLDTKADDIPVLIVEHKNDQAAFAVSEFYSPQKLVIIPFDEGFEIEGLAGTTVLGGRRLGFIVDVPTLLDLATGKRKMRQRAAPEADVSHEDKPVSSAPGPQPADTPRETPAAAAPLAAPEAAGDSEAGHPAATREFLVETEKLFPDLNEAIFQLESKPDDPEILNTAFRLLHTIKGNFIMMGLNKGGQTVHSVETVLDHARDGAIELTPQAMDVLMDGVSYIEEVVRMGTAGTWTDQESESIIEQSAGLLPEPQTESQEVGDVSSAEFRLAHEAIYRANSHRRRQTPFYQCYVEFEAEDQPSFLLACLIYKRICALGDALATVPLLSDVEKGIMEGQFKVLLATSIDPEELDRRLTDLLTTHYGATLVQVTRFE